MKTIYFLLYLILSLVSTNSILAQTITLSDSVNLTNQSPQDIFSDSLSTSTSKKTAFALFHIGAGISEFSKINNSYLEPISNSDKKSYRAGITVGLVNKRFFQSRLELGYAYKRVVQDFAGENSLVSADVEFHSVNGTLLPIILKGGSSKFGGFIGLGGYGSYHLTQNIKYTSGGKEIKMPTFSSNDELFSNHDYGIVISGGIYYKKRMIELRIENGLNKLYSYADGTSLYNRSLNLLLHF